MGKLFVIRHGETEYNRLKLFMGQANPELNKNGLKQAESLGKKAKKLSIDLILSSTKIRCKQTAKIVNKYLDKEIIYDRRLVERNIGVYKGLTEKEVKDKYQGSFKNDIVKIYNETPPKGESANHVQKRVFAAMRDVIRKFPDKRILVITHGYTARMINKFFNPNISERDFFKFAIKKTNMKEFKY